MTRDSAARPPSWRTAASEADAALRQLSRAQQSLERSAEEVKRLQSWGDLQARVELARRLTEGDDGGVMSLLVAGSESEPSDAQRSCRAALERLRSALVLTPVGERGEGLRLRPEQLQEFDLLGSALAAEGTYRVVRPGWLVDEVIVARPVIEAAGEEHHG